MPMQTVQSQASTKWQCLKFTRKSSALSCVPNPTVIRRFQCMNNKCCCCSWKARGLLCSDPIMRKTIRELLVLSLKFTAIAFQDVRSDDFRVWLQSIRILRSHVLVTSHPSLRNGVITWDIGGVGLLLSKGSSLRQVMAPFTPCLPSPPRLPKPLWLLVSLAGPYHSRYGIERARDLWSL